MKPIDKGPKILKAKRHRGRHKWSPWKWRCNGQYRERTCLIPRCAAYSGEFSNGDKYGCRPERFKNWPHDSKGKA
jgi:hypothetical protein